jgi:site-specific DNA recombinase
MMQEKPMCRAALYARVSSDQQAEAGTIESQVVALQEQMRKDGVGVDPELCFIDDGYSGSTLVRPALERLRDAASNGAVERLYVQAPDRLARSYVHQVLLVDELKHCGLALVFLNRAVGETPEDQLLLQVQGVVAEYERAKILERSRRGRLHAARQGKISVLASSAPYGYRYVSKQEGGGQARYEVVWDQAQIVRKLFTWVGEDRLTIREAARRLTQQRVPTRTGKQRWDGSTVWGILQNPAYKGTAAYGKTHRGQRRPRLRPARGQPEQPRRPYSRYDTPESAISIEVPAIVSEDLFAAVAEQLEENRQRQRQRSLGARHLLQGLLVCTQCGYACHGKPVSHRRRDGTRRSYCYYRCGGAESARFGGKRVCPNKQVRSDLLEQAVWDDVCAVLTDPQKVEEEYRRRLDGGDRSSRSAVGPSLDKLIHKVKRGISRLIDAYAEGLVEKSEFEPRLRDARERLERLQADAKEQADHEAQEQELRLVVGRLQEFADQVRDGLQKADWHTRRAIIRAVVKRIEVEAETIRVVYRISPGSMSSNGDVGNLQGCWRRQ